MATWKGERDGQPGIYLDSPFCPRFFPDTEEGRGALTRQIDLEIRVASVALVILGEGVVAGVLMLAGWRL